MIEYDPTCREHVLVMWDHITQQERLLAMHRARINLNETIANEEAKL